jgi:hypothetical protein
MASSGSAARAALGRVELLHGEPGVNQHEIPHPDILHQHQAGFALDAINLADCCFTGHAFDLHGYG